MTEKLWTDVERKAMDEFKKEIKNNAKPDKQFDTREPRDIIRSSDFALIFTVHFRVFFQISKPCKIVFLILHNPLRSLVWMSYI